jgi:hypothetical protein
MTTMTHDPKRDMRVSLREPDMNELVQRYPKLARTEIADVVMSHGPLRDAVELQLERLSELKR